jgi:arylsulfatase A-like enzyme
MKSRTPNILFLCTDQQRFDTLGCYGNPHIRTPNLDRLAAEGALFEQCYVQSPVCAPSRASVLTGRYLHSHGLWANGVPIPPHEELFPQALLDAGYDTGLIGKLHLSGAEGGRTEPRQECFRLYEWSHDPFHGSPDNAYHRWLRENFPETHAALAANRFKGAMSLPADRHYSRWVSETAAHYLRDAGNRDQPFFLWVNWFDPHHPFDVSPEYSGLYDPDALPAPLTRPDELANKPPIQTEASLRTYAGVDPGFPDYTTREIQEMVAAYYGKITQVDDEAGRVLAALDAAGLRDDTLVIFSSDHGDVLGDHRLLLKGPMMYESLVHVPLMMRWPGAIPAGTRKPGMVQWIDLTSTMTEAAGVPPLPRAQGASLLPMATGQTDEPPRDWALSEFRNTTHPYDPPVHATMLRYDIYKIVVYHGAPATKRDRAGELYDLAADPGELYNLWDDPAHAARKADLLARLMDTLVATEDRTQPRLCDW